MKLSLIEKIQINIKKGIACGVLTNTLSGEQFLLDNDNLMFDLELSDNIQKIINQMIHNNISGIIDGTNFFLRIYGPAYKMIIVGSVHIAQFLIPMSKLVGFEVTVIDPREAFVNSYKVFEVEVIKKWPDEVIEKIKINSRTAIITLTHDSKLDDPTLVNALQSNCFYIGALGSKKTHQKRLERLSSLGIALKELTRINGPIGIDINAKTPQEIAISILAQVIEKKRAVT